MLAFEDIAKQNTAKISILVASALAATLGFLWMKTTAKAIGPRQH
jgi:Na+/H+ antiporter NhaA